MSAKSRERERLARPVAIPKDQEVIPEDIRKSLEEQKLERQEYCAHVGKQGTIIHATGDDNSQRIMQRMREFAAKAGIQDVKVEKT